MWEEMIKEDKAVLLGIPEMPSPPIQLFLTTIASQTELRRRQEYLLRASLLGRSECLRRTTTWLTTADGTGTLQVKKIPFVSYDLASDENAKRLWRRKAPPKEQSLPGILVGGKWPGVGTVSVLVYSAV